VKGLWLLNIGGEFASTSCAEPNGFVWYDGRRMLPVVSDGAIINGSTDMASTSRVAIGG
jgi:hypothetical protein